MTYNQKVDCYCGCGAALTAISGGRYFVASSDDVDRHFRTVLPRVLQKDLRYDHIRRRWETTCVNCGDQMYYFVASMQWRHRRAGACPDAKPLTAMQFPVPGQPATEHPGVANASVTYTAVKLPPTTANGANTSISMSYSQNDHTHQNRENQMYNVKTVDAVDGVRAQIYVPAGGATNLNSFVVWESPVVKGKTRAKAVEKAEKLAEKALKEILTRPFEKYDERQEDKAFRKAQRGWEEYLDDEDMDGPLPPVGELYGDALIDLVYHLTDADLDEILSDDTVASRVESALAAKYTRQRQAVEEALAAKRAQERQAPPASPESEDSGKDDEPSDPGPWEQPN